MRHRERSILFSLFLFAVIQVTRGQDPSLIKLIFAGDIMGHDSQIESAWQMGNGSFDYTSCFLQLQPYLSSGDIVIGNLEVTFAGTPYKGYPQFSSPDELARTLKQSGFDILVNANNHALDRGKEGLERTLDLLDKEGIIQTGVFRDAEERQKEYPLIVEKKGIRLALLNYTYGTNGLNPNPPNIVNYIDSSIIREDLSRAKTAKPDFILALMHWGREYERIENKEQQELARFLFRHGADVIIGSHPHVVQPVRELDDGNLVVYSMGNLISNQRKRYTDGGILFEITLKKDSITKIIDYNYLPVWVHKPITPSGTAFQLIPAALDKEHYDELMINDEDALKIKEFVEDTRQNLTGIPEVQLYP